MKVVVTGASGFVGSNIVKVLADRYGDTVVTDRVDMTDAHAVRQHVASNKPDAIVHCAITNDWDALLADRTYAWNSFVESTRTYVRASNDAGAAFVLVSTDWVFDGTQGGATETTPPNPVNFYGFLKAAGEMVAIDNGGAVARVSGVNGMHWARPATPRLQDPGFGYFVASLVDALERGNRFTVWEASDINMRATPSLASMCGDVIRRIVAGSHKGTFHCCGADSVTRRELAMATTEVFNLDASLIDFAPPPTAAYSGFRFPYDTSLSAVATSDRLGSALPNITDLLSTFRRERETGSIAG